MANGYFRSEETFRITSWRQPPLVRMSVPQASDRAGSTLPPARDVRCEARAGRGPREVGGRRKGAWPPGPVSGHRRVRRSRRVVFPDCVRSGGWTGRGLSAALRPFTLNPSGPQLRCSGITMEMTTRSPGASSGRSAPTAEAQGAAGHGHP